MKLLRVFSFGLIISLLGSLPLGSLNVMAWRIYDVKKSLLSAAAFSLGVAVVEVIYVRITLVAMKWIVKNKKIFRGLEWFTVGLFIILAYYSFFGKISEESVAFYYNENLLTQFGWGVFLCAINPAQIPFWFLWSTYLYSNNKLEAKPEQYNWYCGGIGIGTLLGEAVYVFGGAWLVMKVGANQKDINYFVGAVFVITAILQLYKLIFKKNKLEEEKLQSQIETFNSSKHD